MIPQLFRARPSRSGGDQSNNQGLVYVGTFGPSKLCWDPRGELREQFQQGLRQQIVKRLSDHFGSVPGSDNFTISLYMIGRSPDEAKPTILFISRSKKSQKDARRVMKDSRCLARHPEYAVEYVNKDPGSNNIVTLASGTASKPCHGTSQMPTEVLYDPSRSVPLLGLPIYIRHPLSIRPATANAVCVDDRIFLQTVYHAFDGEAYERESMDYPADEDLEILSDTESEADDDDCDKTSLNETNSDTSDREEGLERLSYPSSPRNSYSMQSTFSSNASTSPPTIASPKHSSRELSFDDGAASDDGVTTVQGAAGTDPNPAGQVNEPSPLNPSAQAPLTSLGRLFKSSALHDWALVEITSPIVRETLSLLLMYEDAQPLAYDRIARSPVDGAAIYTCTASGGKICGMLSPAPSFTRLPNTTSFQEIYIIRLDGSLATGDCGSAIIDCRTGDTYGHLVAGCKTTGTAHAVAAYQTALAFGRMRLGTATQEDYTQARFSRWKSPDCSEGHDLSNEIEFQTAAKPSTTPPTSLYQRKHLIEASNLGSSSSLTRSVKRWPQEFSESRKPKDERPYLDSIIDALYPLGEAKSDDHADHATLFMLTGNVNDGSALVIQNAIRLMRTISSQNLYDQWRFSKKSGTAWLDDRTIDPPPARGLTVGGLENTYTEDAGSRKWTQSYPLQPRTYPKWLTAHELKCHLREKRFDHETLMNADRRLIYIADPDAYDMSALIETATYLQRDSLRDTICAYLAQSTSIKAITSQQGLRVFQLELHISYFTLRRSRSSSLAQRISSRTKRPYRGFLNVDFLTNKNLQYEDNQELMTLYQAQISVTICGTDHSCWQAYCFEDRDFDNSDNDEELTNEKDEEGPKNPLQLDKITGEERNFNIQDPREYFLRVVLIRVRRVRAEWEELVRFIEEGIRLRSWSQHSATRDVKQSRNSHDSDLNFYECTLDLLDKTNREVSRLNDAWGQFCGGDLELFTDTASSRRIAEDHLQMKDEFGSLRHLEEKLNRLAEQLDKRAQALRHCPVTESQRTADIMIYILSPFAIASTFFGIDPSLLEFERNLWSFSAVVLLCVLTMHGLTLCVRSRQWQYILKRTRALWNRTAPNIYLHRTWRKISGRTSAAWNVNADLDTTESAEVRRLRRRTGPAGLSQPKPMEGLSIG